MNCENIHDELKNMNEIICPLCNEKIGDPRIKKETCCSEQNIENHDNMNVCINCGSVYGYDFVKEYVDFYDNRYKIHRKSVYQRKYHIENITNAICYKNKFQISLKDRDKILRIFKEIESIVPLVNKDRKRMININFILRQIFLMLGLPYKKISISRSKKTIQKYEKYWITGLLLKFDKIIAIIQE